MGKLTNPRFDYKQVTDEEKSKLIYFEGQLAQCRKRVADEIIKFGEMLAGAQEILANYSGGVFVAWIDSVGVSTQSAYNAIAAHREFGSFQNFENIEVSAMYVLAKSDGAKKKAMKLADKGVKVTHSMAKELVEAAKPKPKPRTVPASEDTTDPFEGDWDEEPEDQEDGEDGRREADGTDAQESTRRSPGSGTDQPAEDLGRCPNCLKSKWTKTEDGYVCAKCSHPHGEPTGGSDEEHVATQRSKTVKTAEALMRAFGDLNELLPKTIHEKCILDCKRLLEAAKGWK